MFSIVGRFLPILVLIAVASGLVLWPMGIDKKLVIVPYVLGNDFNDTQKAVILQGLKEIENVTCVRFYKRDKQRDYVKYRFSQTLGYAEGTGRIGGMQEIALSPYGSMNKDRPMHEMLHTLGFHHMQQRYDRDNHVWINLKNVKIAYRYAFVKQKNWIEIQGTPYDYDSLLHYPKDAFSKNGLNTIVPKNATYLDKIGHQTTLSAGDALRINRLYNCPGFINWN